jgi:aminopeptidase YwaD
MKKIILGVFIILNSLTGFSQDSTLTREFITHLASPEMHGRGYSYNGDSIAAAYIREQFIKMGVQPLENDYFQSYGFKAFSMEGPVSFKIGGRKLSPFKDYRIAPFSKSIKKSVRIIHADPKMLIYPEKIATFNKKHEKELSESMVYIDAPSYKIKDKDIIKAYQKELGKLYFSNPFQESLGIIVGVRELPIWSLSNTDVQRNYALIHVSSGIIGKKDKVAEISFDNNFGYHKTQNVCGIVRGTQQPDSFIVYTAHYDHIGSMGDSVIFYGAHDNASGTATVLNLANYYQKHPCRYSTAFILLSGEEAGLRGSSYFAKNPLIQLDKIKFLINLDMMGGGDEGIMVVNGQGSTTKPIFDRMVEINKHNQYLDTIKSRPNAANSDHYPFSEKGVPAIFIYAMGGKTGGYHHWSDTGINCSLSKWDNIFWLIVSTTEAIATEQNK